MSSELVSISDLVQTGGTVGIVLVLFWAFWKWALSPDIKFHREQYIEQRDQLRVLVAALSKQTNELARLAESDRRAADAAARQADYLQRIVEWLDGQRPRQAARQYDPGDD